MFERMASILVITLYFSVSKICCADPFGVTGSANVSTHSEIPPNKGAQIEMCTYQLQPFIFQSPADTQDREETVSEETKIGGKLKIEENSEKNIAQTVEQIIDTIDAEILLLQKKRNILASQIEATNPSLLLQIGDSQANESLDSVPEIPGLFPGQPISVASNELISFMTIFYPMEGSAVDIWANEAIEHVAQAWLTISESRCEGKIAKNIYHFGRGGILPCGHIRVRLLNLKSGNVLFEKIFAMNLKNSFFVPQTSDFTLVLEDWDGAIVRHSFELEATTVRPKTKIFAMNSSALNSGVVCGAEPSKCAIPREGRNIVFSSQGREMKLISASSSVLRKYSLEGLDLEAQITLGGPAIRGLLILPPRKKPRFLLYYTSTGFQLLSLTDLEPTSPFCFVGGEAEEIVAAKSNILAVWIGREIVLYKYGRLSEDCEVMGRIRRGGKGNGFFVDDYIGLFSNEGAILTNRAARPNVEAQNIYEDNLSSGGKTIGGSRDETFFHSSKLISFYKVSDLSPNAYTSPFALLRLPFPACHWATLPGFGAQREILAFLATDRSKAWSFEFARKPRPKSGGSFRISIVTVSVILVAAYHISKRLARTRQGPDELFAETRHEQPRDLDRGIRNILRSPRRRGLMRSRHCSRPHHPSGLHDYPPPISQLSSGIPLANLPPPPIM